MSGDVVGRFEVEKVLGEGGMGRVVLAKDPLLGRRVAVKTLLSPSADAALRFADEAQITGQLAHPNVIPVHAFGSHEGTPFLAMRFVQGRDLKALVKALGKKGEASAYPIRRRLRLFLKVCEAMAYAHQRGVIHRDLKPANVMLGDDDEVLVMDWGLAKPIGAPETQGARTPAQRLEAVRSAARAGGADLTQEGAVVGTPAYMPPEQAGEGALDARADVYSLGALLYELVTHRQPYNGSGLEVIAALVTGKPPIPRPREVAPAQDIPPAVEAIILKAMSREPDRRHADAAELARDLEAFLDDRPVSCHRETAREAAQRLVTRHRVSLIALGITLLALALAGLGALVYVRGESAAAGRLADEAGKAAALVEVATRAAGDAARGAAERARAEARGAQAAGLAAEYGAATRTAVAFDQLQARRDELRARLDALALEVAPGEACADARARIAAARSAVDLALGRAAVKRRPRRALDLLPGLEPGPEGPLLLARALVQVEREPDALAALSRADWQGRGDLAAAARVVELQARDAPTAALRAAVDQALTDSTDAAWLLALRAHTRAREGEFAQAAEEYASARALDPADAWIVAQWCTDLFRGYVHTEHVGHSINTYLYSLSEREFAEGEILKQLCNLWATGHYKETLEAIDGMVPTQLTRVTADRQAAAFALLNERWGGAEERARRVLEARPGDRRGLGLLAEALAGGGKLEEAKRVADQGLKDHPTDGRLAYARGEAARLAGEHEDAVKWLRVGAPRELQPHRWQRLAAALLELDDEKAWAEGVTAMRRGLELDVFDSWQAGGLSIPLTGDPLYHRTLGDLRRKQGDLPAAALHYQRALRTRELIPRTVERRGPGGDDALRLGEVHEEMGLKQEAWSCYAIARDDPATAEEAARRQARLEGR